MKESSKATQRRLADATFPWREIFKGHCLDVGAGNDGLQWPGCDVTHFDQPDGSSDDLTQFFATASFDVIHGSQVCEHFADPVRAIKSWLTVLKPGGHIVATVPDFVRYEKMNWPSKFNHGHVSTWSLDFPASPAPIHCKLPEWLAQFPVKVLRCALVDTNFDYSKPASLDQTFRFEDYCECFVEFVVSKL